MFITYVIVNDRTEDIMVVNGSSPRVQPKDKNHNI